jgi:hypothetical protein
MSGSQRVSVQPAGAGLIGLMYWRGERIRIGTDLAGPGARNRRTGLRSPSQQLSMRLIPVTGDVMGPSHGSMIRALPAGPGMSEWGNWVTGAKRDSVAKIFFAT